MSMPSQSLHVQALKQCITQSLQGASGVLMHKQRVIVTTDGDATSLAFHPPVSAEILLRTFEQCSL